jgi:hypothetical protein
MGCNRTAKQKTAANIAAVFESERFVLSQLSRG